MTRNSWERFNKFYCEPSELGISLDISRMNFGDDFFETMSVQIGAALAAMDQLESGAIANPDENRRVGHYWLRDPDRAPTKEIAAEIKATRIAVAEFARQVIDGEILSPAGLRFDRALIIGIGGSALGPQLISDALACSGAGPKLSFLDNTDPDGIDRVLGELLPKLESTLFVVISKSGGTPETRNGMLEAIEACRRAGVEFSKSAVAITGEGSKLDIQARSDGWIRTFPMWDWVGGRTSVLSAVGLLPAALAGVDIDAFLDGARLMDGATRSREPLTNPAALLALMWHYAGDGAGRRDMVVLPYKDRLILFSRYLQQLVMESLGKELDLDGNRVHQGLSVFGNKGSTDQHAYVQQLREGVNNFFVTFIETLKDREGPIVEVEADVTSGDYLEGFYLGTREALTQNGRESITITLPDVSARSLGALIALFERAVGLYATLVNINAYHQPGVEAGKKAASEILDLQRRLLAAMREFGGEKTAEDWAVTLGDASKAETVFKLLSHLAANRREITKSGSGVPSLQKFGFKA